MYTQDFRRKYSHIPFAREGIPYVLAAMFTTIVTALLGWQIVTVLFLAVTLLIGHFFRDPERVSMAGDGDVVSPADGKVIVVQRIESARFTGRPALKISIFMSVLDVHVNRIPISGTIQAIAYRKGKFLAANFAEASDKNEQNWLWVKSGSGADVIFTQVAGLIARRIVCWPGVGDRVIQAERFGMVRFGSRMDVYVPEDSEILVKTGQQVYAGETVLCRLK